jgi:hypothetical protein
MNRSSSNSRTATNIARSYLQLQRLRQLVQEAERSLAPHDVKVTPPSSGINLERGHQV